MAACGFRPVYMKTDADYSIQEKTAEVYVAPIPEKSGRDMRLSLQNLLDPQNSGVTKKYVLTVSLKERTDTDQAILDDNTASRASKTMYAFYTLTENGVQKPLLKSAQSDKASYNILTAPYSTVTAEQTTREQLIKVLAQKIALHVADTFNRLDRQESTLVVHEDEDDVIDMNALEGSFFSKNIPGSVYR